MQGRADYSLYIYPVEILSESGSNTRHELCHGNRHVESRVRLFVNQLINRCILAELYTGFPIFPGENEHEQLACIMEVIGVPDRRIVDKASRRKLFFGRSLHMTTLTKDALGAPRPFVSQKGKRRRPASKTLAQVLKTKDELFVDFIGKCLTWDPDQRLKPQAAMRHPWILAGRRRAPSIPGLMRDSSRNLAEYTNGNTKKGLLISPPTPLMARSSQPPASRTGVAGTRFAK